MIDMLWLIILLLFSMNALAIAALARINVLEDKIDRYHHEKWFESFYDEDLR